MDNSYEPTCIGKYIQTIFVYDREIFRVKPTFLITSYQRNRMLSLTHCGCIVDRLVNFWFVIIVLAETSKVYRNLMSFDCGGKIRTFFVEE